MTVGGEPATSDHATFSSLLFTSRASPYFPTKLLLSFTRRSSALPHFLTLFLIVTHLHQRTTTRAHPAHADISNIDIDIKININITYHG